MGSPSGSTSLSDRSRASLPERIQRTLRGLTVPGGDHMLATTILRSEVSMKALRFRISIPRFLIGKALGRFSDSVVFGALSGLSIENIPDPALPGPEWARLEVLMCGICGSDISALTFKMSPALEPFGSFPAVFGHEVLARVLEVGPEVTRVRVGDRVSVDPAIACVVRGRPARDSVWVLYRRAASAVRARWRSRWPIRHWCAPCKRFPSRRKCRPPWRLRRADGGAPEPAVPGPRCH